MRNQLVYDVPTRVFHWSFAGLFVTAYTIANVAEDSLLFPFHMLAGLLLVCLVVLRTIWGVVGTRHARFRSLTLSPMALLAYVKGIFGGERRLWAGHNPASSWTVLIMMALAAGLGITGYLMTSGGHRETYEELHELFANAFLAVALLHIAGIVLHVLHHHDGFALSMVDGCKQGVPADETIEKPRPFMGVALLAMLAAAGAYLLGHYDSKAQTLNLFGTPLRLGENEGAEQGERQDAGEEDDEQDD